MSIKYSVVTFGCRVNQADSCGLESQLMEAGGVSADTSAADLIIVNTCSVTGAADQAARQAIRKAARENPRARIVVTGCYATRLPEELAGLPGVAHVVPNERKEDLVRDIGLTTAERFGRGAGPCGAEIVPGVAGRTAYTLRVQTGCDETCSYCIIPTTRGKGRSRLLADVLDEIEHVCSAGFREIALTGVHLGSYGRDLSDVSSLPALLQEIDRRAPEGVLFRISSLEPMDCSSEIVDLVAASDRFAPHFHLPLQHASNRILAAMRRPYTLEHFARLVASIRQLIPHAAIGSDVIAGFPGENEEDFSRLESFLAESPLTHLHVFPYSDRTGTDAAALAEKVHGTVVRERATRLRTISRNLATAFRRSQLGCVRQALTIDDGSVVVTDNYLKARLSQSVARNLQVRVRLTGDPEHLTAEIVTERGSVGTKILLAPPLLPRSSAPTLPRS